MRDDIAHSPDLFKGTPVVSEWPAKLQSARGTLDRASSDLQQLDKFSGRDQDRAERLLRDERSLRESALRDSEAVEEDANKWLDFQKNVPHYLAEMQREYDQIHAADLAPVTQTVTKAEQDWPAKKSVLDSRLATLRQSSEAAETQWRTTEAARQDAMAGKATGAEIATLIQANETLAADARNLTTGANELTAQSAQLYDAWDKILVDLDTSHRGFDTVYSEKIKTVHTRVGNKPGEVTSDERWVDVSPSAYRAVDKDLGMAIAHKDAGLFDSEAQTTAQPPGFAYIAPPSQGSNQYGYWTHSGGQSFWTFLPQYLIMRELLWGHSYQPIYINEYNGYSTALRSGRTYYGNETPASPAEIWQPWHIHAAALRRQPVCAVGRIQGFGILFEQERRAVFGAEVISARTQRKPRREEIRIEQRRSAVWFGQRRQGIRFRIAQHASHAWQELRPPPIKKRSG